MKPVFQAPERHIPQHACLQVAPGLRAAEEGLGSRGGERARRGGEGDGEETVNKSSTCSALGSDLFPLAGASKAERSPMLAAPGRQQVCSPGDGRIQHQEAEARGQGGEEPAPHGLQAERSKHLHDGPQVPDAILVQLTHLESLPGGGGVGPEESGRSRWWEAWETASRSSLPAVCGSPLLSSALLCSPPPSPRPEGVKKAGGRAAF